MTIEMLRQRLAGLKEEAQAIHKKAADEKRTPNPEELDACDKVIAEYRSTERQLNSLEELEDLGRTQAATRGRPISASSAKPTEQAIDRGGQSVSSSHSTALAEKNPWKSFGEYLQAVHSGSRPGGHVDHRLRPSAGAATTYVNEGSGADGGFLVGTQFSAEIERFAHENEDLLGRCNPKPVDGNGMEFPVDETTHHGTAGVQAYWTGEAAQYTERKISLQYRTLSLHKLTVLVPVTDEMLEDASFVGAYISEVAGGRIGWKVNDAIINGNGAGRPQGILGAGCLASQAKETSQTAATINAANVNKMFGRMVPSALHDAVWLIAPDAYNQLPLMTIGQQPVWTPPGAGLKEAPGGTLLGRPVIISMTCQTLGTKGDIYFGAFGKGYKAIVKRGGIQEAISMHLYFDYGLQAFRFTFRMNGEPWLQSAISPAYGSSTLSAFVSLDTRA